MATATAPPPLAACCCCGWFLCCWYCCPGVGVGVPLSDSTSAAAAQLQQITGSNKNNKRTSASLQNACSLYCFPIFLFSLFVLFLFFDLNVACFFFLVCFTRVFVRSHNFRVLLLFCSFFVFFLSPSFTLVPRALFAQLFTKFCFYFFFLFWSSLRCSFCCFFDICELLLIAAATLLCFRASCWHCCLFFSKSW